MPRRDKGIEGDHTKMTPVQARPIGSSEVVDRSTYLMASHDRTCRDGSDRGVKISTSGGSALSLISSDSCAAAMLADPNVESAIARRKSGFIYPICRPSAARASLQA